jgi:hypothetical protein
MSNLGKDVLYTATAQDVKNMKALRDDHNAFRHSVNQTIAAGDTEIKAGDLAGRSGHQAHVGNELEVGRQYAAKVVRDWGQCVNLQVFLDGNDSLWVTSVSEGHGPGQWVHTW